MVEPFKIGYCTLKIVYRITHQTKTRIAFLTQKTSKAVNTVTSLWAAIMVVINSQSFILRWFKTNSTDSILFFYELLMDLIHAFCIRVFFNKTPLTSVRPAAFSRFKSFSFSSLSNRFLVFGSVFSSPCLFSFKSTIVTSKSIFINTLSIFVDTFKLIAFETFYHTANSTHLPRKRLLNLKGGESNGN